MWSKIKQNLEYLVEILPFIVAVIIIIAISILIFQQGLIFSQLISLINSLIWPAIVLSALLFFRKIFTYLFFSLEEFNFFGTRGRLKNVELMIRQKANELYQKERAQRKLKTERKELAELKDSKTESIERVNRAIAIAENILKSNEDLQKQNSEYKKSNEALLSQINFLQQSTIRNNSQPSVVGRYENTINEPNGNIEELKDVGTTNPLTESSDNKNQNE